MSRSKLISIIIPAYNAVESLPETLDSIKNQTYDNYEAIIIDDGSIDNTSVIAKEYTNIDPRFKYHYQENGGVSMARNKGLELTNGDYICFLDADDYFEYTFLEKMYKKITERDHDVCYCGYNMVTNNSNTIKKTTFKKGDILLKKLQGKINIHTTGWMIKKEHLDKNNIRFQKGVSWGEDFEFFNEVVATTLKISYVNEYLTNYKVGHDENQLSNFSLDKIDKDYESIMRSINNKKVNKDKRIEEILINYRLHGTIIYRLVSAINMEMDKSEIQTYYNKYKDYISKWTFNNGLRSAKLNLNRIKIIKWMKKI